MARKASADNMTNSPVIEWERLAATVAAVEGSLSRALRRTGLGLSEFRALGRLAAAPKREVRLFDLAEGLGLDRSSVSRLVTRLERDRLVARQSCGDDRRGVFVVLTDDGERAHADARAAYEPALETALASGPLSDLQARMP